jgi:hypothetical protein
MTMGTIDDMDPLEGNLDDEIGSDGPMYGPAGAPARRLTHEEVKAIVSREIEDSLGGLGSKISEQQRTAIRMYQGKKIGNEIKDRSQVVSMDVLETIEWAMPSLMRIFFGSDKVWRFKPRAHSNPERAKKAEQDAKDATAYINHVFLNDCNGFSVAYDWFKSALMEKNGIVKAYWHEERYPQIRSYTGLTEDEVTQILSEQDVEPLSMDERSETLMGAPFKLWDIDVREWKVEKGPRVDAVPNEEFVIARRVIRLNDRTAFTGHRKRIMVSDLVAMGFPYEEIALIPSDDMPEYSQNRTERLSEDETAPVAFNDRMDPASREIWTTDCYIRIDQDGDGFSELRNIFVVGEHAMTVLSNEEVAMNPFCSLCPIPMPHKFYGNSLADLVTDLQHIRTTLMRQMLDHVYLSVNPRLGVVQGQVEYEDLLTVRPGGLVRLRSPDALVAVPMPPMPREALDLYNKLEETRGNRTGVIAHGTEIDASAVNSTASGLAQLMAEKAQKVELIARIFANTGLKDLGKKLLRIAVENDTKEQQVYINDRWVTMNPSGWDMNMDVTVEVGLGAGQAIERVANLEKIAAIQKEHISGGLLGSTVTLEQIVHTSKELVDACGFANTNAFFKDPIDERGQPIPPPQPPPDPKMKEIELKARIAETEVNHKSALAQLEAEKQRQLDEYRFAEMAQKKEIELERIASQERIAFAQMEAQEETARIAARSRSTDSEEESDSE